MNVVPPPPYSLSLPPATILFPQWKIKLKGRHLDTTKVTEEKLQAVLNTFTEHNFQDAFKKMAKCWVWCICWLVCPKLVFDHMDTQQLTGGYLPNSLT
jgi:hypothetical protein